MIRKARRDDLPALVALLRDDELSASTESDPSGGLPESYSAAFDEISSSTTSELFVAEEAGRVVGCFQLDFLRRLARAGGLVMEIESVHVLKEFRGRGIGAAMMRAALARARERGCVRVQLTSQKRRVDAHRFYERLGFSPSHLGFKIVP